MDAQPSEPEDDFIEELEQKDEETLKEITTVLTAPFNVTKETKLQEKEEPANDTSVLPAIEEAMAQEIEKMEPKVEDNKSKVLEESESFDLAVLDLECMHLSKRILCIFLLS